MHTLVGDAKFRRQFLQRRSITMLGDYLLIAFRFGNMFVGKGRFCGVLKRIKPLQNTCNGFFYTV